MKFTYLLLNAFTISIPLLRSFEHKINFVSKWKYFIPANLITAIFFLVWDYFKTKYGVWQFNEDYIIGLKFFGLPIEEYLFFLTVPYACTFIYEAVLLFLKKRILPNAIKPAVAAISLISFAASPFFFEKAYTFSVLFIGGIIFLLAAWMLSTEWLEKFLLSYAISIIPMFFVNGMLTSLPVVIYNNSQNLGIRVGSIPVEDFLYSAILLVMNIGLYEIHRIKYAPKSDFNLSNPIQGNIISN
jgi:lycopene cyclase domain-containing protein